MNYTDIIVGAVGAAKPYAAIKNREAIKSALFETEVIQITNPIAISKPTFLNTSCNTSKGSDDGDGHIP